MFVHKTNPRQPTHTAATLAYTVHSLCSVGRSRHFLRDSPHNGRGPVVAFHGVLKRYAVRLDRRNAPHEVEHELAVAAHALRVRHPVELVSRTKRQPGVVGVLG